MGILRLTDGVTFDTSGPLRVEHRADGYYLVAQRMLLPCDTHEDAERLLVELANPTGSA
jgi:hypothetical protein